MHELRRAPRKRPVAPPARCGDHDLFCEYFVAPSDADAASAAEKGPPSRFTSFDGFGIEPEVDLAMLEQLLVSDMADEQCDDPTSFPIIASARDDHVLIYAVVTPLVSRLANVADDELQNLSVCWSQTQDFAGLTSSQDLAQFLIMLRRLARQASADSHRLYCRLCV